MAADNYQWWTDRFRRMMDLVDEVRVDHFRGFAAYWAVPAGSETAKSGAWKEGPGLDLFRAVYQKIGRLRLVAEDLGVITDDVCTLKDALHLPGMKSSSSTSRTGPTAAWPSIRNRTASPIPGPMTTTPSALV